MRRALLFIAALSAGACGGDEGATLSVFAAASLTDAMQDAAHTFERSHPDVHVRIVTGGSQVLRSQIEAGAPADLFVPASPTHAELIAERLETPHPLACNAPVIVVPPRSNVRALADLAHVDRLVVGTPEVPIGAYTERILSRASPEVAAGVRARIASRELDVRQVLSKVLLGEADAAIVYRTDAIAAGERVRLVPFDPALLVVARYPIAVVRESAHLDLARSFARWLRSDEGLAVLRARGFTRCEEPS